VEDEEVDIDKFDEVEKENGGDSTRARQTEGEDEGWADEEPDDDREGWKMKVWIEDDEEY
jgi:COMPASS component SWD1